MDETEVQALFEASQCLDCALEGELDYLETYLIYLWSL